MCASLINYAHITPDSVDDPNQESQSFNVL